MQNRPSSPEILVPPGTLLAAGPDMLDPNFMHAVVLICQHDADGAVGFIINRQHGASTSDVFPEHPVLGQLSLPIFEGGPVETDAIQFLHRVPETIANSIELASGLHWGGSPTAMVEFLAGDLPEAKRRVSSQQEDDDASENETPSNEAKETADLVRLFVGYSGWGAGQLEQELFEGVWLPAPGSSQSVFEQDSDQLWRKVLRSLGEVAEGWSEQPPDPSWN